jgi:hypothetical protein
VGFAAPHEGQAFERGWYFAPHSSHLRVGTCRPSLFDANDSGLMACTENTICHGPPSSRRSDVPREDFSEFSSGHHLQDALDYHLLHLPTIAQDHFAARQRVEQCLLHDFVLFEIFWSFFLPESGIVPSPIWLLFDLLHLSQSS